MVPCHSQTEWVIVMHRPKKIISGGQTGADLGGIVGAKRAGIQTGGCAPLGYITEKGPQVEVLKSFGLYEHTSPHYNPRTFENVSKSSATAILSTDFESNGTRLTITACTAAKKDYLLLNPYAGDAIIKLTDFLNLNRPLILNVAGNRESVSHGITSATASLIYAVLSQ